MSNSRLGKQILSAAGFYRGKKGANPFIRHTYRWWLRALKWSGTRGEVVGVFLVGEFSPPNASVAFLTDGIRW